MSDLQCPARLILVRQPPAGALLEALAAERVVATYDAPVDLAELADRHRGEAVVVVGEHGQDPDAVLLEIDSDGRRVTPWPPDVSR